MNSTEQKINDLSCPTADIDCPQGPEKAEECRKVTADGGYNPLTNFRDSAVLECGVERMINK